MLNKPIAIEIDKPLDIPLHSVQFDKNSRFIEVYLLNNSLPLDVTRYTVTVAGVKPDGEKFFNECDKINAQEGLVRFEVTEQMNVMAGLVNCELKIYNDSEGVLTTKPFDIKVTRSLLKNDIESTGEFRALTEAISKVQGFDNKILDVTVDYNQKINQTNAQLSQIDNSINYVNQRVSNRNFKPRFGISGYWGEASDLEGTTANAELSKIESDIKIWEEHGCDEIVIPIHISYNQNNKRFYIAEKLDDMLYAVNLCSDLNIKVTVVKVHLQRMTESIVNSHGVSDFKMQYKSLLENIADKFADTTVEIMTVLNEVGWIYESDNYEEFSNECLNIAKNKGYITGITCAGFSNFYNIKTSVITNSDKIFVNTYPRVSSKKEKTELSDVLNGWNSNNDVLHIKKIKTIYPNKDIIISECGVQDYWIALSCPENYKWDEKDKLATNGEAPDMYLIGLLKTFNESGVEGVWWWYDLKWDLTKNTLNYYLKGVINHD